MTWNPNEANVKHDRIHSQRPQRERTRAGWRREREDSEQATSGANDLHAQRAEGKEWCWGPRDHAQDVEERTEETHVGQRVCQHVDGRTAHRKHGIAAMECHAGRG